MQWAKQIVLGPNIINLLRPDMAFLFSIRRLAVNYSVLRDYQKGGYTSNIQTITNRIVSVFCDQSFNRQYQISGDFFSPIKGGKN